MIGTNIRKLREERRITQQQLADAIGISFQAVSKWECETTIPDVSILPNIAEYFEVSIDELFKENMDVYKNKAQRLMAIYESDIENSDYFEKADKEYRNMFSNGEYDDVDLGDYAYLNDCRMKFYAQKAEEYYLKAIEKGKNSKSNEYYKNQRQYILFLSKISRGHESIKRYAEILENEPDNPMSYSSLLSAYKCVGDYGNALKIAEKGLSIFPNDAILLVYAGDTCKNLGKYNNAIEYWDKAFTIDPEMIDTRYSLAFYYIEQSEKDKATETLNQIFDWNNKRGFTIENKWVKSELDKLAKI